MPSKKNTTAETTGTEVRENLTKPNETPNLSDDVVTLRLKQNAFVAGEFCKAGKEFPYARDVALDLLRTTSLYEAK